MKKTVLDVGNCNPDHGALDRMLTSRYDVVVLRAHQLSDALQLLGEESVDLILINRKLDIDYSDGVEILRYLKRESRFQKIPIMIITNHDDHQKAAVAEGAEYGIGKLQYSEPATHDRLSRFLDFKTTEQQTVPGRTDKK